MNATHAILLFSVSAGTVFAQAFQSRNVNQGHMVAAALTSVVIGVAQTVTLKLVPDANELATALYILGGPVGVITAMHVHSKTLGRRRRLHELKKSRRKRKINHIGKSTKEESRS